MFKELLGVAPQATDDGAFIPSKLALKLATSDKTDYDGTVYEQPIWSPPSIKIKGIHNNGFAKSIVMDVYIVFTEIFVNAQRSNPDHLHSYIRLRQEGAYSIFSTFEPQWKPPSSSLSLNRTWKSTLVIGLPCCRSDLFTH